MCVNVYVFAEIISEMRSKGHGMSGEANKNTFNNMLLSTEMYYVYIV